MINSHHSLDRHLTSNVPSLKKKQFLDRHCIRSLMLHKRIFEYCHEHTNKQALFTASRVSINAWTMKFNENM